MTTHEQHTIADSAVEADEAAIPVTEAPRTEDESLAVAPESGPAVDSVERDVEPEPAPAVDSVEPDVEPEPAPPVDSVEPDTAVAEDAEVADAEPPSTEHQSSADELLFAGDDLADLRARWAGVQAAFVDDPKDCVQKADVLVSDLVEQLTSGFATARSRLEEQWSRGEDASTEDLRVALMHYREFFERLLAV
jgi:hypothetical protein